MDDAREVRYAYPGRRFADAVVHHRRGASRMVSVGGSESIQCHDVTSSHAMWGVLAQYIVGHIGSTDVALRSAQRGR